MTVALPGEAEFDAATAVFNLAAPAQPAAAVTARTVEDVRAAVRLAAERYLPVRVHTTGHASATYAPMDGALLIRTAIDGPVEVDPERGVARIPAGRLWGPVVEAAARHGLAVAHGTSPTVGVVGYLLRGGVSFYSRKVGLAANAVRAIELVTADGSPCRVDAGTDPELFWALRGGGGGFGVVTAVEIDLFPMAKVVTGAAFWPAAHAEELVSRWREWTVDAPGEVATSLRVMNLPPLPGRPVEISSGPVICLDGLVVCPTDGDLPAAERHADDLLGPLRAVAAPVLDTWAVAGPAAVPGTHMDPPNPVTSHGDHLLLSELGDDGVAAFLGVFGVGSGSPLVSAELRQLGGACAVPDPAGGVLSHLPGRFVYQAVGVPSDQLTPPDIAAHYARARAALAPWDTGRTAPNFVASHAQPQGHLTADQIDAVDRIRKRVDPTGLFHGDITPHATAV
jgi:FAD/FMN-containing dehydrogenase